MGINNGPISFVGTVGGITMDRNGVVRKAIGKRKITAERTKENNSEFGIASKQGKVIRQALREFKGDKYLTGRMLKIVKSGIVLDNTHARGKRILSNDSAKVLTNFELNTTPLTAIAPIAINIESGNLEIGKLGGGKLTVRDIKTPQGTTEIELMAVVAKVNIDPAVLEVSDIKIASAKAKTDEQLVLNQPAEELILKVQVEPDSSLLTIVAVGIKFYQEVNKKVYSLNNRIHEVAQIVSVLPPIEKIPG